MADRSSLQVFSTKKAFQDRTVGFYLSLASAALLLIAAIFYLIYSVSVALFVPGIFAVMLLGALSGLLVVFTDIPYISLLPTLLAALAFGLYLDERIEMFVLMASGVYGMSETGAILECVVAILILTALSFLAGAISCFTLLRKSTAQADKAAHAAYRQEKRALAEETLRKEKRILADADTPITLRMLSGRSKGALLACTAVVLVISLLVGGVCGYLTAGGSREEAPDMQASVVYGISVTRMPNKTQYNEGEQFLSDGMTVTLHSSDGRSTEAQGWYTSADDKTLEVSDTEIAVYYQDFSVNIYINVTEAEVAGIFSGEKHQFKFKENGVVQMADAGSEEYTTVGVWRNAGNTITAVISGEEYAIEQYSGAYYFAYDGENVSTTDFHVETSFHFEGYSQYGDLAGPAFVELSEDGTALLTQKGYELAKGTWYKEGQTLYVTLEGNEYKGTFDSVTGLYTLLPSASAQGYTFNYTMTNTEAAAPDPDPEPEQEPEPDTAPSDDTVVMEMLGYGKDTSEGRTATLTLLADHTFTLTWVYVERDYLLASYTGTWEESGGTIIIRLTESDGSVTDYPCTLDGDTYSFSWVKDKDPSDPNYTILLTGTMTGAA